MMDSITKPVLCGFCGKEFDYTVYPEIHIPGDHKLKKKVLNKTLDIRQPAGIYGNYGEKSTI
jgi:hypothetical protein